MANHKIALAKWESPSIAPREKRQHKGVKQGQVTKEEFKNPCPSQMQKMASGKSNSAEVGGTS